MRTIVAIIQKHLLQWSRMGTKPDLKLVYFCLGKTWNFVRWGLLATVLLTLPAHAQADTNVVVSFSTTNATPLNAGFAGFNTQLMRSGIEYYDPEFQLLVAKLSPGWLRYPAGTQSDAFDWATGLTVQNWVNAFTNYPSTQFIVQNTLPILAGKGGALLTDFAAMCANVGGAKIVVCVNDFTDTPQSAGALAQFALSHHLPVAAWELSNEPYAFYGTNGFWTSATNYLDAMKPYRDAIKNADSNALVAIFYSPPTHIIADWDNGVANYTNKYWDMVVFHDYPRPGTNKTVADFMASDNGQLATNTTDYMVNYLMPQNKSNVTYMVTEYDSGLEPPTSTNQASGTLYGGVYVVEFAMRMSTLPQMMFVGSQELQNAEGINVTNDQVAAVTNAYYHGLVTNTVGLPFGYYITAQAWGEAVANWAFARSSSVLSTTSSGGPTVDAGGGQTIPAIYAQAYQGNNGKRYVLLTNKGVTNALVQILQDGVPLTNQLLETFVAGSNPAALNTSPQNCPVQIQTQTVTNPFVMPSYAVVRLEWTVFTVPAPGLRVAVTNIDCSLEWSGLTNVVYCVQASTNLTSWATLEKVSNVSTNFSVTDSIAKSLVQRFYRLLIP